MKLLPTLLAAAVATTGSLFAQNHDVRAAPFNAIRWSSSAPDSAEIRLERDWYGWTAIDDVAVADIVAFCKKQWPSKWRKRVGEDLVEALTLMDEEVGDLVELALVDLNTGKTFEREKVPMTEANRQAVLAYNQGAREAPDDVATGELKVGDKAPRLVCNDLDGKTVSLEKLRGKPVIVDFWATWCAPCIKEIPSIKKAHDKWSKKGLVVLGVSIDEPSAAESVKKAAELHGMSWTVLHDEKAGNAAAESDWFVTTIPQCFLIDAKGRIQAIGLRGDQVEDAVAQLVKTGKVRVDKLPSPGENNRRDDWPELSPFTGVRVSDGAYEVRVDGTWYKLVSLEGLSAERIMKYCQAQHGEKAEKRFAEDLVEVLAGIGLPVMDPVIETADLVLEELDSGKRIELNDVSMTEENRKAVWKERNQRKGSGQAARPIESAAMRVERIERNQRTSVTQEFAALANAPEWSGWTEAFSRAEAERDLDQLEWLIEHTYSYRDMRGVEYQDAFDSVRAGLAEEVPLGAFAVQVARLLSLFGDGHTRVRGLERVQPPGYLPFLVAETRAGVVAFKSDRSGLVDEEHPFLVSLDGRPVSEWLEVAGATQALGSEQFVRFHGLRNLRMLNANRAAMGLDLASNVEVVFTNASGEEQTLQMPIAQRKPTYGSWPRTDSHRMLDGNVGYLRIASMDDDRRFVDGLVRAMDAFRDTRALIIDVRGNGGGTRDALNTLYPYFLDPKNGPQVVNIGAYRLRPGDERGRAEGYLENRFMFPAEATRWTDAERSAIRKVAQSFTPDWKPNPDEFSAWHYLVMSPGGEFHYDRPVIVLMDSGCFSATDIFLGAFADLPAVTLMGAPSGGGSGRSEGSRLAESGISLRVSSMASFRSNGQRYDGKGVEVDELVHCAPEDYLAGGQDSVLEAALNRLEARKQQ